jgi:hypothetical protein
MAARSLGSRRPACSPTSATTETSGRSFNKRCREGSWSTLGLLPTHQYCALAQRSSISSAWSPAGSAAVSGRILARRSGLWRAKCEQSARLPAWARVSSQHL